MIQCMKFCYYVLLIMFIFFATYNVITYLTKWKLMFNET